MGREPALLIQKSSSEHSHGICEGSNPRQHSGPGIVDTPLHKDNPKDFLKTLSPMHSVSSVQEIVDAVLFLTEAPRITGEVLHVNRITSGRW